jgi:small-conductance mechanosensitive channel
LPTLDASVILLPQYFQGPNFKVRNAVPTYFGSNHYTIDSDFGVFEGVDPERVIELLKCTAASHPGLAKEPLPQVYVTSFSAGAVTFQLRAWTDRHEDWAQLRSDLSIAVKDALAREGIAIA